MSDAHTPSSAREGARVSLSFPPAGDPGSEPSTGPAPRLPPAGKAAPLNLGAGRNPAPNQEQPSHTATLGRRGAWVASSLGHRPCPLCSYRAPAEGGHAPAIVLGRAGRARAWPPVSALCAALPFSAKYGLISTGTGWVHAWPKGSPCPVGAPGIMAGRSRPSRPEGAPCWPDHSGAQPGCPQL